MKTSKISFIIPLVDAAHSRKAGSKAINLSKLIAAHFDVPRGFVISADAHSFHIWASGVRNIAASMETPEATRAAILATEISDDIWHNITDAYHRLSLQLGFASPNLILRSSPMEDSSADAHLSLHNVSGEDDLKAAIKEIWASAWSEEAISGRNGDHGTDPAVAIIVQQMLDGAVRGKVYTTDPKSADMLNVVVECESIGEAARFNIDLKDFRVVKQEGAYPKGIGEANIIQLAEQAILAEGVIAIPMKLEWLYEGGRFWLLQAAEMSLETSGSVVGDWQRISAEPVSFMARKLFWSSPRKSDGPVSMRLKNGHVYIKCASEAPQGAKGWQLASERLLEKWRKESGPELSGKASTIIGQNLAGLEYARVMELLVEAGDLSSKAADWLDRMRHSSSLACEMLRQTLESVNKEAALYDKLTGGLPCSSFMRDARLQEFGDRFQNAQQTGKLNNEKWWKSFRAEVNSFAQEYGFSFKDSGEMWDPASWKSWIEDLDVVFRMIGAIAKRGNRPTLVTLHCMAEESARQAEKEVSEILAASENAGFQRVVKAARGWLCAKNEGEQAFALACTALRLVAMETGRRLCKSGIISQPEDIFCLSIDEVKSISSSKSDDERSPMIAKISARKHEHWLDKRMALLEGLTSSKSDVVRDGLLKGLAVGPGQVSGRARVAHSIEDAGDLEAGDILVISAPRLAWTPYLGVAGGVVSSASCAECVSYHAFMKDYNIPAVAGCEGIMDAITDGQRIIVNGSDGTVDLCRI